ncbi:ATP-binding protein [Methanococcoides alaskense]|uniref:CO dehydrogenase maturation factor n=1 Tax=Methanococcoides alaskense TaxID=325778 RepID=A0AA90TXK4_9EURY|nr:adenylyl-sulfate kinase [Methanococcoides alaskense]MDA0525331.1 adenylyl-sulfate kinase [Methanococcoides alaskense]MDR6221741.1 CO dehydrogenase maturation factor [Methanococcoides alaskense]
MKTLLCGKGGSGKSTLTALIARSLSERGCNVLVIDNDESNFGLHMQMGLELPDDLLNFLGGKKNLVGKMMEAFPKGEKLSLFDHKWKISTIPEGYVTRKGNLSLVAVGKIHEFGEGCACPMGALAKQLIQNIELGENEFVLVDTEAGIEHFGRGVEEGCDVIFMVADPSYESIRLSEKISKLADNAGKQLYYILNRAEGASREILSCGIPKTG